MESNKGTSELVYSAFHYRALSVRMSTTWLKVHQSTGVWTLSPVDRRRGVLIGMERCGTVAASHDSLPTVWFTKPRDLIEQRVLRIYFS